MARSIERDLSPSRARERDLVLAFQAGDAAAYDTIDHSCRPAAERICRRLLINPADVEEAVQETMVRAYQGLPRFNGSYALTAWIARIATNVCLDSIRARSRRPQNGGTIEPNMEPRGRDGNGHELDPEELVEKVLEAEDVRSVLAALPERHRTALVLREFEGLSHRKIAEMLDTSPQRVKALIHRAKAGFRRAWTDDHHPGRLAAFAPLLTPINWVRRFFGRAPEFDSTAASAATVASTPVAHSVVTIATERASVLAAVMLAGTVSFAVQQGPNPSRAEPEEPVPVEIVQAPTEVREAKPVEAKKDRERPEPEPEVTPSPMVEPSPATEELEEVVLEPPKESQEPQVGGSPSPSPPPHPSGFSFSFGSDRPASSSCGCGSGPIVSQDQVAASQDGLSSFQERITAAAIRDAAGQNAWPVEITQSGNQYSHRMTFTVTNEYGGSIFDAQGGVLSTRTESWGGWSFTYHGTYQRRGGPREHAELPQRGSYDAVLTFSWRQSRLVSAVIQLAEST